MIAGLLLCAAASVIDGDTIRCSGAGRVRMVAIDTPDKEKSSVCLRHIGDHVCDDYLAAGATIALINFVRGKRITFRPVGHDFRNNRIVAQMFAGGSDLQCFQLAGGDALTHHRLARYMVKYDRAAGYPIMHRCRATVAKAWR